MLKPYLCLSVTILVLSVNCAWAAPFADQVTTPVGETLAVQQQSQRRADDWQAQREVLIAQLTALEQQQQQLQNKKAALVQRVDAERNAVEQLTRTIEESKRLTDEMVPFLSETQQLLTNHVAQDLPFLQHERDTRLKHLSAALADPDLAIGEKFRRLMETLRIESEYGRDIDVVQQSLPINGRDLLMNQLRIGRLALFAQSLDGEQSVIYSMADQSWRPIERDYNRELGRAIEMGLKHRPIDLLTLPIGRVVSQ